MKWKRDGDAHIKRGERGDGGSHYANIAFMPGAKKGLQRNVVGFFLSTEWSGGRSHIPIAIRLTRLSHHPFLSFLLELFFEYGVSSFSNRPTWVSL